MLMSSLRFICNCYIIYTFIFAMRFSYAGFIVLTLIGFQMFIQSNYKRNAFKTGIWLFVQQNMSSAHTNEMERERYTHGGEMGCLTHRCILLYTQVWIKSIQIVLVCAKIRRKPKVLLTNWMGKSTKPEWRNGRTNKTNHKHSKIFDTQSFIQIGLKA